MLKKLTVVFCVIALALCVFSVASAEQRSEEVFKAGYAMVDINPYWSVWTAKGNSIPKSKYTESNIMPLPMDGYGGSLSRLAEPTLTDDNGDGKVGEGDGLQATCIALQYGDQTLLLIAVDVLRIDDHWGNDARELISDATGIPVGNIMLSASHTHGGVDMDVSITSDSTRYTVTTSRDTYTGIQISAYRDAYVEYVENQILVAATTALDNAVKASAHRGTINANTQSGKPLNGVRHYKRTDANGVEYVAGPNFNGSVHTGDTPVSEGNQQLHVLEFIPENGDEPIVLVNWRAHTNTGSKSQNHYLTSDYVGSVRKTLSNAGYRSSFYLGAAGNHGNFNGVSENEAWYYVSDYAQRSVKYGTTLAEVALALLENKNVVDGAMVSNMAEVATGEIRTKQLRYRFDGNKATYVENEAATNHNNGVGCKKTSTGTYPCAHTVQDESGNEVTYVLASAYHVDNIIRRYGYGQNWVVNNPGNGVELNVLTIGRELAFVTAPMELFDLYSDNTILAEAGQDNDWDLLAGFGYGTPFVFSCTNEHWGYVPNKLGYNYNKGNEHAGKYAVGSYEAQTSYFAEGTGEKLIDLYTQMLTELSSVTKSCAACGAADVQWQPLTAALLDSTQNALAAGHYYLDSDLEIDSAIAISGANVCLNLNGCSIRAVGTSRTIAISGEKTLNVLDTSEEKIGAIVGNAQCTEESGGNIYVNIGTLNLYSGTITGGHATKYGGNVFVYNGGTFNLYGGLVENGTVDAVTNSAGGNICGNGGNSTKQASNICLAGGMVRGGAMGQYTSNIYSNVFAQGNLILTGSSEWEEPIQVGIRNGSNIIVRGTYTGKLNIWAASGVITEGAVFGSYEEGASIVGAQITLQNEPELKLALVDGAVKIVEAKETAKIGDTIYANLGDALAHGGTAEDPIVLLMDVDEQSTLVKTAYLDLNGHDIANVITNSYKLYVMDTATADYDVEDEVYGKILVADNVANVKAMTGYLKAADELSFHKYEMMMDKLVVNTRERGITYMSSFKGDRFVQEQIMEFGIAMRAYNAPNQTSIWSDPDCKTHVALTKDQWTNDAIKSVYVSNIIDPTLDAATNQARAQVAIYGRAYILLEDGTMLLGQAESFTMQGAMEHVDSWWSSLTDANKADLVAMYNNEAYKPFMDSWDIPNIKAAAN